MENFPGFGANGNIREVITIFALGGDPFASVAVFFQGGRSRGLCISLQSLAALSTNNFLRFLITVERSLLSCSESLAQNFIEGAS